MTVHGWLQMIAILAIISTSPLAAQTNFTATFKNPDGTAIPGSAVNYVKFELAFCGKNSAKVNGVTLLPGATSFSKQPSPSGALSFPIYGNDVIQCGTIVGGTRWDITFVYKNVPGPTCRYNITGATWDANSALCDNASPVPAATPSYDTTHLRLDGGNQMSGPIAPTADAAYSLGNPAARWDASLRNVTADALTLNALTLNELNGTPYANTEATIAAQIAACPTTGCTVDASGMSGAATFASGITFPSAKAVRLLLGHSTITGPCPLFNLSTAADGSALIGVGPGDPALTGTAYGTKLVCTSGSTAVVTVGNGASRLSGIRVENLSLNAAGFTANGLLIDTVQNSTFRNVEAANATVVSFENKVTNAGANVNSQFNRYDQLSSVGSPVCLQADNNATAVSNWTQNVVTMLRCNFTGTAGVLLNGGDNNWFYGTQTFRAGGVGTGVVFVTPVGGSVAGGLNNHFYGLIGGVSSVSSVLAQPGTYGNVVFGYDRSNGELAISLAGTAEVITEHGTLCGPSACSGATGTHPTPWLMAQGNAGNPPTSNPTNLISGCGLAWNYSNGGGESDFLCNIGGGSGASGLVRWYGWNGAAATLYATLPNSAIGEIVGTTANQALSNKTLTAPTINTGVTSGSGFKHQRFGATCSTAAAVGSSCTSMFSWTVAFADANYTLTCTGVGPTGTPILSLNAAPTNASIVVNIEAATAAVSSYSSVECIAVHD